MDEPFIPRPAESKTRVDGRGGLIRVTLVGEPHGGHDLYIDEHDLPAELDVRRRRPFEWWPPTVQPTMAATTTGQDPEAPPIRYVLRVPDDTGEPLTSATRGALNRTGARVCCRSGPTAPR